MPQRFPCFFSLCYQIVISGLQFLSGVETIFLNVSNSLGHLLQVRDFDFLRIFSAKMYELMGWNTACRYKILGHKIVYDDEMLYIFDLLETEIFLDVRKAEAKKEGAQARTSKETENVEKMIMEGVDLTSHGDNTPVSMRERKAYYPADWRDSFGLPVEEHSRALQIDIKDGYAEFNVLSDHKGDSAPSSGRRANE